MAWHAPRILLVLLRKKPVERISVSNVAGLALANARASGYFLNSAGVTMFTRLSVHCALKMVAIRSCNGFPKSSSQCASDKFFESVLPERAHAGAQSTV